MQAATITLTNTTIQTAHREPMAWMRRIAMSLRERCSRLTMDPRTRYLSDATDACDLEMRISAWDEQQARAAMFSRLL